MGSPVSNGSGPQRTVGDSGIFNAIKTKLSRVAEFMGSIALSIPFFGSLVSNYRARRDFVAQLPDDMTKDQVKTADITQQIVNRTHSFGQLPETRQNNLEAGGRKTTIERNIDSLKQEIEKKQVQIDENRKSMDDNLKLEGTDKAIPGLNSKLGSDNFGLELQIEALKNEIINLQMLDPDLQLQGMKETISELDDIHELQTLLRDVQTEDWPHRDQILDSVTAAIETRIAELKKGEEV